MTERPLSEQTPAEIDEVLAENWQRQAKVQYRLGSAWDTVRRIAGQRRTDYGQGPWDGSREAAVAYCEEHANERAVMYGTTPREALAEVSECEAELAALEEEAAPGEAEYRRRRWNRYFLVTNTGGHVHRERNCSTCYVTTRYNWLPTLSGCDESAMVAEYGEMACTICFPGAPVMKGYGDGTSALARYGAEEKAQRKAEKDARAAAKAAKRLAEPVRVRNTPNGYTDRIETIHAAKAWIKGEIDWPRGDPETVAESVAALTEALEARGIEVAPLIERWTKAAARNG